MPVKKKESGIKNQESGVKTKVEAVTVKKSVVAKTKSDSSTPVKKTIQKGVSIDVYDVKGKVLEAMELPQEIFGSAINETLMKQAVRVYLANQRRGTSSTKTRGEVRGSTRKIYKQKGTGRARHGGIRAPLFVGGGIAFGPQPRDLSLNFPKKMRRRALFSALSSKLKDGEIKIVSGLSNIEPKTKAMVKTIGNLELESKKKKILFVIASTEPEFVNVHRAVRNIEGINLISARELNTYTVLNNKILLFMKESIDVVSKTFLAK